MKQFDPLKQNSSLYIGAWVIMGIINMGISYVFFAITSLLLSSQFQSPYFWHMIVAPSIALMPFISFSITYNLLFKSLNTWRVLPWLYVLGTLGFMNGIGNLTPSVSEFIGQDESDFFFITSIAGWIISLLAIRKFIVAKSSWRP